MPVHYENAVQRRGPTPNRIYMRQPSGIPSDFLQIAAEDAVVHARRIAPKSSGASSGHFLPIWGKDYFGIQWVENYVWYQEMGINPFVMSSLAGKMIPMWVSDLDGKLRKKNPKIKQRTTVDGRRQVLIFRKAAKKGERKDVKRRVGGIDRWISVPKSYPGAPGRISHRNEGRPRGLSRGGQIGKRNGGVRWRHPGMAAKFFLHTSLLLSARTNGFDTGPVLVAITGEVI